MPIKTWLIWWVGSALWFSAFAGFGTGLSVLAGLIFTILAELMCRIFDKLGRN
jgi:hypothetical protein